ncbi:MAG: maltokinase N-terminal cap-like domain-containing protein [Motilibacteraceae bacterium]
MSGTTSGNDPREVGHAPQPVLDPALLGEFLSRQRWFSGKGRQWQVTGSSTMAVLQPTGPQVRIDLVRVEYSTGEVEVYQLPLVVHREPVESLAHVLVSEEPAPDGEGRVWVYDALHDKEVTGLWLEGLAEARSTDDLVFHPAPSGGAVPTDARSIVIGAEQSNTSLIFGDVAILKVFRRLAPGLNPDIEIHEALASAGSAHVAEPLGWLEGRWRADGLQLDGSLAMLQEFLRNGTEGWEMAKASVRDLYAEGDLHAEEVGGDFAGEAARLGAATAEVHADLARTLDTGVLEVGQLAGMAEAMRARLDRAVSEVPALEPYSDALSDTFGRLAGLEEPVAVQRVHGDYHLGQVMRTIDGWKLLDFEGEPAKSLDERRALDTPLKDVAGMLRSFDYAARHLLVDRPGAGQLEYRAAEWAERNRDAFCEGYGTVSGRDPRESDVLLRALETDKAVYEVVYEARNRPSWLRIPMSAIERLATAS